MQACSVTLRGGRCATTVACSAQRNPARPSRFVVTRSSDAASPSGGSYAQGPPAPPGAAESEEAANSSIAATMRDLDALLGLQAELEAAGPAGLTPTSATAVAASAEALAEPVPKEWAHLKAAEVVRRQKLVRRREQLNVRQKDLEVELAAQDRKVAHHTQRLGQLRLQRQQLVEQQRLVSEGIDPEGTALARMAAEQRRQAEDEADRREVVNFALMFWGAFALLCATRGWALDALQGAWMDVTFM